MCHIEMLPSHKFSIPDKENLHYRIIRIICKSYDILILSITVCNLLFLRYLLHTVIQIPVTDRLFKFKLIRCRLHLLL